MNWLDFVVVALLVGAVIVETLRGFGRAMFDALALFGALWIAWMAAPAVAKALPMASDKASALAIGYGIAAVAAGALTLVIAHFTYNSLQPNAGMFDQFLGLIAGVGVGMMVSHAVVKTVALTDATGDGAAAMVTSGLVSGEMYDFHNYHSVVDQITGAANYHREINLGK